MLFGFIVTIFELHLGIHNFFTRAMLYLCYALIASTSLIVFSLSFHLWQHNFLWPHIRSMIASLSLSLCIYTHTGIYSPDNRFFVCLHNLQQYQYLYEDFNFGFHKIPFSLWRQQWPVIVSNFITDNLASSDILLFILNCNIEPLDRVTWLLSISVHNGYFCFLFNRIFYFTV